MMGLEQRRIRRQRVRRQEEMYLREELSELRNKIRDLGNCAEAIVICQRFLETKRELVALRERREAA